MSGLVAYPASPAGLATRALAYLQSGTGPAASFAIVRDVLGILHPQANRHSADRIAAAFLGNDPRFVRTSDGRWTAADPASIAPSPPLDGCRFAVVDVETTGVRARRDDRIIEIAVVLVDGCRDTPPEVAFHSLVNPGRPVPTFVQHLTGIDPALLLHAPPFDAALHDLLHVLSGCVFVAHNARFDWAFVSAELLRSGGLVLQGPRVCTLRLARRLLPHLERRNLDAVCFDFGIEIEGRHRAVGDAVAAARVLVRLLRLAREEGAVRLTDLMAIGSRLPANGTTESGSPGPIAHTR